MQQTLPNGRYKIESDAKEQRKVIEQNQKKKEKKANDLSIEPPLPERDPEWAEPRDASEPIQMIDRSDTCPQ